MKRKIAVNKNKKINKMNKQALVEFVNRLTKENQLNSRVFKSAVSRLNTLT